MNKKRYLYSVYPKRPIKNIIENIPIIKTPKSLQLSKDEVEKCLKFGSIYRRFANEGRNEKVNTLNIDRLHNDKFMTEEEYAKFLDSQIDSNAGTVINNINQSDENLSVEVKEETSVVEDEKNVETSVEEVSNTVEEPKNEAVEEEVKEETSIVEDEKNVETSAEEVSNTVEEVSLENKNLTENSEAAVVVEKAEQPKTYNNKDYGGKNKYTH